MSIILEKSRNELITQSKRGEREKGDGKTRYEKRLKSRVSSSNRTYNRMDMNSLIKDGIVNISIEVHGETNDYLVKLSWSGFLDALQDELKRDNKDSLDLRVIIRALVISFNKGDVYISCSCEDFFYRFGYWATIDNINSGEPQLIPSDETNPNNKLGPGCKHILLVLSNTSWVIKVASVIINYITYMEKHRQDQYARIIYPAIYGKEYEEPVQTNLFDSEEDELSSEQSDIDIANKSALERSRFQKGNVQGVRFAPKDEIEGQEEINNQEENI